jgi:hypothetical protein
MVDGVALTLENRGKSYLEQLFDSSPGTFWPALP